MNIINHSNLVGITLPELNSMFNRASAFTFIVGAYDRFPRFPLVLNRTLKLMVCRTYFKFQKESSSTNDKSALENGSAGVISSRLS